MSRSRSMSESEDDGTISEDEFQLGSRFRVATQDEIDFGPHYRRRKRQQEATSKGMHTCWRALICSIG